MRTNCINCGAAIDVDAEKCPFCETSYFDLTAIDFTSKDPVALKLYIPYNGGKFMVRMLALPKFEGMELKTDTMDVTGGMMGNKIFTITRSNNLEVGVSFSAISKNGELFRARREDQQWAQ